MLKIDSIHSMDEYLDLLGGEETTIYIDNTRLEKAVQDAYYLLDDLQKLTSMELAIESAGDFTLVSPDAIIDCLLRMDSNLESRLVNRRTKKFSLDMKRVVQPLIDRGVAYELLTTYKDFRSYQTYSSFLATLAKVRSVHAMRPDGTAILEYKSRITPRENLRVYYSDIAVVSIPRRFSNIVTSKGEGYHLAWCDYPQADWRFAYNLFIKDDTNVAQMQACEDTYEGLARLIEGERFTPEGFKASRKDYKVNCLKTFYNSRDPAPIPTAMREYFRSRPRYKKYIEDLYLLYKFKLPIPCTSYFGFTQLLPEAKYPDAFLSKGLNTPIQTCTSEVVMESAFGILQRFWDLGYSKDDINIYYVRHDELLFMFRDTIIKDSWIFKDCSQICIDGFVPIPLEFHFGDFYKEDDELLTARITASMNSCDEKLTIIEPKMQHAFNPVPSVEQVFVQLFPIIEDGNTVGHNLYYYVYKTGERIRSTCSEPSPEQALYDTMVPILESLGNPDYVLVRNESLEFMDRYEREEGNGTLMKVVIDYDSNVALRVDG